MPFSNICFVIVDLLPNDDCWTGLNFSNFDSVNFCKIFFPFIFPSCRAHSVPLLYFQFFQNFFYLFKRSIVWYICEQMWVSSFVFVCDSTMCHHCVHVLKGSDNTAIAQRNGQTEGNSLHQQDIVHKSAHLRPYLNSNSSNCNNLCHFSVAQPNQSKVDTFSINRAEQFSSGLCCIPFCCFSQTFKWFAGQYKVIYNIYYITDKTVFSVLLHCYHTFCLIFFYWFLFSRRCPKTHWFILIARSIKIIFYHLH